MFAINFNFPYRKKDGSLITMEKALDGAGVDLDLVDLDDVAITTPTGGNMLVYDGTAQKWKNTDIDLTDLDDVAITTPADGESLVYDGTAGEWKNKKVPERFVKVAEAAADQTWGEQLTTLFSAFNSLSSQDKARAVISATDEYAADGLYRLAGRNVATFSLISLGGTGVVNIVTLRLSNSTAQNVQIATTGTVTNSDLSSTTNTMKLVLCLD